MKGAFTAIDQIFLLLAITRFYIGELTTTKNGYKNLHRLQFSGIGIDQMELFTGIVHIELITCFMVHMHRRAHLLFPQRIVIAELAKFKSVWMTGIILFPHQLLGNPFTL